ncbi:histidine--tRNA ligase [Actinoalloteichus hymeniacidonis]|uniref:Histidine--tRNA ligase n=1 Tax=Actinoalloteichus hymeniacidonis TaxID=340345 RepID=A0AAC9N0A7_9PSEU|nr:histidine--tRNA ligase [Actinoalloteichus hymeniacidonis]AOS64892.1 histidyl-tRNA synthetase [Actinoalloteichus hymeniacidonis]MBB5907033.1 histidyl-tRNA synthetase [Actinoalloteichus hymeniacidonis]
MKTDNTPPRGTRDLLPAAVADRDHVLAAITEVYRHHGYHRIETPALEDIGRLTGGQGGENEKLIYRVLRRGITEPLAEGVGLADLVDLGLRFDLTVPLTRFYGAHHAQLPMPFRSFQFGPVWRAERPQKGRYRQFNQCDIDIIGEESVLAEVELIEATIGALDAVGLTGTTVRISDRRLLAALAEHAGLPAESWDGLFITLDKLDKIGWEGVTKELVESRGLPAESVAVVRTQIERLQAVSIDTLVDTLADALPTMDERALTDLGTTVAALAPLAETAGSSWEFDPTLVRGMGYYTGQVFEIVHPDAGSSLAGGGRYDRLIGRTLGRDVPACGFSIGFERIVDLLGGTRRDQQVAVLHESEVGIDEVLSVARALRAEGRSVAPVRRRGKFGAQLDRLTEWGFTSFVHLSARRDPAAALEERTLG